MSEYVIMPSNDYKAACDAIRNISEKTDLIKSGDMLSVVTEISNKIDNVEFKSSTLPSLSDSSDYWVSIAYGVGKFVVISYIGEAAYSYNGIDWVKFELPDLATSASSYYENYVKIKYCNDKFIAFTNETRIYYSSDGINWYGGNYWLKLKVNDVAYGNGKYIMIGDSQWNGYTYNIAYSSDGINWTSNCILDDAYLSEIIYNNSKFFTFYRSTSGSTILDIAAYSTDGINWTKFNYPFNNRESSEIIYANNKFICVNCSDIDSYPYGYTYSIAYSSDGINWNEINDLYSSENGSKTKSSLAYGNGKFVLFNKYKPLYSMDGINWIEFSTLPVLSDSSDYWNASEYGDGKFVAIARKSNIVAYCDFNNIEIV